MRNSELAQVLLSLIPTRELRVHSGRGRLGFLLTAKLIPTRELRGCGIYHM